jgi:hypothetical protein
VTPLVSSRTEHRTPIDAPGFHVKSLIQTFFTGNSPGIQDMGKGVRYYQNAAEIKTAETREQLPLTRCRLPEKGIHNEDHFHR